MKNVVAALLMSIFAAVVSAAECDCSSYPFKPNPPCFGICVARLSSHKNMDLSAVKNIDSGVAVGIKVLSDGKNDGEADFKNINGKADLEREALKSLNARYQDQ